MQLPMKVTTMTTTQWTNADLAHLTEQASLLATYNDNQYCDGCGVISVSSGDKYCAMCADDIINYLWSVYTEEGAVAWQEQQHIDMGWY
jgi:hypothetical protein